eukprot:COSAG02_NODE_23769_length_709_cov_0.603279_1_plen_52_part_10
MAPIPYSISEVRRAARARATARGMQTLHGAGWSRVHGGTAAVDCCVFSHENA